MSEETTTPDTAVPTDSPAAPTAPKVAYGFAVLITEDGDVFVERKPDVFNLDVEREASLIEVRRYASEILMDLQAQSAAEYVALKMAVQQPNA